MSKEKQIKKMEEIGSKLPCDREDCSKCLAMNRRCKDFLFAERLYNAGYRKASDVAREMFEEIIADIEALLSIYTDNTELSETMRTLIELVKRYLLAELKKKYTEERDV